ncbi:MAG: SURF1 family protein, partial [Steroidobacteraceae bacterium]
CALFVHLGQWQWHKAQRRQAEWTAFARGADRAVDLGARVTSDVPRFQRVRVTGRFDPDHQFLLDNRIVNDEAGYEVLTPLTLGDGRVLLIDRGWVPFTGSRSRLPDVHLAANRAVTLTGRVDTLPAGGLSFGKAPPSPGAHWPKVTSYPDMAQLAVALGASVAGGRLEPRIVLLDPHEPYGYVREWRPPGMSPAKNMSYAAQWWLFAVTLAIIWLVLSAPKPRVPRTEPSPAAKQG